MSRKECTFVHGVLGLGFLVAPGLLACSSCDHAATRPHGSAVPDSLGSAAEADNGEDPAPRMTVEPEPVELTSAQREVAAASINGFAFELYPQLVGTHPQENVLVSPASAAMAFSMVHAGAAGESAAEIAGVFHIEADREAHHRAMGRVLRSWNNPHGESVELRVVNRLFGEQRFQFKQPYLDLTRARYAAPLEPRDFRGAPDAQRDHINRWVAEQTADRIQNLLAPGLIDTSTRLVLVNALYFKARWSHAFETSATQRKPFYRIEGNPVRVPMMHDEGRFKLASATLPSDGTVQVLDLPYVGGEFAMTILLPEGGDDLSELEGALNPELLDRWLASGRWENLKVQLPKWRVEHGTDLATALQAMGVTRLFEPETAQLEAIGDPEGPGRELYVSAAVQKAFIEVDEQGTEAAAATAVVMAAGAGMPQPAVLEFRADHPFVYLVRDTRSGAILFLGRMMDPSS